MMNSIASFCVRNRWLVVATWVVVLVATLALAFTGKGETDDEYTVPGAASERASQLMTDHGLTRDDDSTLSVVFENTQGLASSSAAISDYLSQISEDHPGAEVPADLPAHQVSEDGTIGYVEVPLQHADGSPYSEDQAASAAEEIQDQAPESDDLTVAFSGSMLTGEGGGPGEGVGLLAAVIILLIAFGSVYAMALPIVAAVFGAGVGVSLTMLAANIIDMPSAAVPLAIMLAVGVGVDYSLLIVTRFREGLGQYGPTEAVLRSHRTAGRSVFFAGATVVIAVLGLLAMGMPLINGIAIGSALAILVTMLASLTLLPALLAIVGRRIDRLSVHRRSKRRANTDSESDAFARWGRTVARRPVMWTVVSLGLLLVMALPALDLRLGFADAGSNPEGDTQRVAYDLRAKGFGDGVNGPLFLAVDATEADPTSRDSAVSTLRDHVVAMDGVDNVSPQILSEDGQVALLVVQPSHGPGSSETAELVSDLRTHIPQALDSTEVSAEVTGATAAAVDYADFTADRLPWFIGIVLGLAFLLLMVVFRSILVPLKAVLMNLLSIGSAYGLMVAIVQWGWGGSLLGFEQTMPITAWVPMMMVAVVFGLSMDYEVFLLSRIKEQYDDGLSNTESVSTGLARTGRVITAAALIMIAVFGGFVLGTAVDLAIFGLGLALAVLIDATLVRMVLVPAAMQLMGEANWWLPRSLARVLPHVSLEDSTPSSPASDEDQRVPAATAAAVSS